MSASRWATESCAGCGAELPPNAHFCPECGVPAVDEPGPTPASMVHVEPHWFGIAPPEFVLGLTVVLLAIAVGLFATGHWPFGLILLGLAALLAAAFLELARRRPRSTLTRSSVELRERAGSFVETWRARAAATAEARRIHNGLILLDAERRTALLELGAAAHRGDGMAEAGTRARLTELDVREAELRAELEEGLADAGERIRQARLSVEHTVIGPGPDRPKD